MFLIKKSIECGASSGTSVSSGTCVSSGASASETPVETTMVLPALSSSSHEHDPNKYRVLFCGTYPIGQSNGYSRVVYYICKYLGRKEDIQLTVYGFQNYNQTKGSQRNDIPPSVKLHDAMATEEPRRKGFGEKELPTFLRNNPQDLVIIFNDPVVTTMLVQNIVETLTPEERKRFQLVSYMDQVYPYQRKNYIHLLNTHFDGIITFTPYWRDMARSLGIKDTLPIYFFPHGFDSDLYYPIPTEIARAYHSLKQDAFLILNLNRNQPRKRWDHTMMIMADLIERHQACLKNGTEKSKKNTAVRPLQLVIGTQSQGFFDLVEILEHELTLRGLPTTLIPDYIHFIPNAQMLSDRDINLLYNACDVGLNTCDGEGFGLCQFEHLALMKPQVAPNVGGFREFLNPQNAILIEPKWRYYIDSVRDGIGGMAEVGDLKEYADGLWKYYQNLLLTKKHGRRGRDEILQHYRWESMVDVFYNILQRFRGRAPPAPPAPPAEPEGEPTKTPACS
jgi:glycosyltransferase involved in cell wall biosynthesis